MTVITSQETTEASMHSVMAESAVNAADVLMGRGGKTNGHAGNKAFRMLVADAQPEYLRARKKEKVLIARRIVAIVQQNGGRFLKRSDTEADSWVLVTDKRAQEKTSQALREGLDVRNHTTRPRKMARRESPSYSYKNTKIVSGKVMTTAQSENQQPTSAKSSKASTTDAAARHTSPSLVSVTSGDYVHAIPALTDELLTKSRPPPPVLLQQYNRQISKSEVTDQCDV